ncbi:MAG: hypothetical protein ABFC98_08165 [Candidatus Cloacimonas sp.]
MLGHYRHYDSELNAKKTIPITPPILVGKYMQLIAQDKKGGYFLPLPPNKH